jgi:hypothetical protein
MDRLVLAGKNSLMVAPGVVGGVPLARETLEDEAWELTYLSMSSGWELMVMVGQPR